MCQTKTPANSYTVGVSEIPPSQWTLRYFVVAGIAMVREGDLLAAMRIGTAGGMRRLTRFFDQAVSLAGEIYSSVQATWLPRYQTRSWCQLEVRHPYHNDLPAGHVLGGVRLQVL